MKQPTTEKERDELVKELQAMEFKRTYCNKLPKWENFITTNIHITLIKLLVKRDEYRDGWISDTSNTEQEKYCIDFISNELTIDSYWNASTPFSFQDAETAEAFSENFKEELEQVKHLIS